jgi:hypothetical protein
VLFISGESEGLDLSASTVTVCVAPIGSDSGLRPFIVASSDFNRSSAHLCERSWEAGWMNKARREAGVNYLSLISRVSFDEFSAGSGEAMAEKSHPILNFYSRKSVHSLFTRHDNENILLFSRIK